jgi:xylose dehydrogenase (NAD/NADP)
VTPPAPASVPRDRAVRVGVLGATSQIYRLALRQAFDSVAGVQVVHEASLGGELLELPDVRRSTGVGAYEAVVTDPNVDLVYVPLPNHLHERWVTAAAAAGRHVLCEKPLAPDAATAQRMVNVCRDASVVLLEAYMSPHHPRSVALQHAVAHGALGGPLTDASARMTGTLPRDNHRWTIPAGGGALADVGIYCLEPMLTAACWDGDPSSVEVLSAASRWHGTVDDATTALLRVTTGPAAGATVALHVDLSAPDQQRLQLTGPTASIEVELRHATPDRRDSGFHRRDADGSISTTPTETGDCYEGMVAHLRDVLRGDVASLRPPARSVALAAVLDQIRQAAVRAGA